ncbi:MAG TPA: S-layer homology domain-containing protein [Candidatus Rifleibacterium sp.]|nr:S-layer homology domain-containing protein [Candidatus Rifleibacterium sp.]HPT47176.1 S-layer homology domain-containing protein [Candidatus Rifleibacterium sp.]
MPSNLPHAVQTVNDAANIKKCNFCERSNPAVARFCGGCGRSTRFAHCEGSENVAQGTHTRNELPAPPLPKLKKSFSLKRMVLKYRLMTMVILMLLLFSLSGFLFFNQVKEATDETANWVDFRAFLARKLEMPHHELDSIFYQLFSESPGDKAIIDVEKVGRFESFLRHSFSQPNLSLFPNPFFEQPSSQPDRSSSDSQFYQDVSPIHPVYLAIKPLSDLGIRCGDPNNCIRPTETITWNDWKQLVSKLFATLSIETTLANNLCSGRSGPMSNQDIRNFLEHLREKFLIKSTLPLIYGREKFFPSRIEAISALASVIKELNNAL